MVNIATRRAGAIVIGLLAAGLGCYGAFEFARMLEGSISYLVIAAPVVAAAAALIPVFAEGAWRDGLYLKSILWWLVLGPAAATVFFAAAERVHVAKAGAEAERGALRSAVSRAKNALANVETEAKAANSAADKVKAKNPCGTTCQTIRAKADRLNADVAVARTDLLAAEKKSTDESPLKAPVWLLPAALDLIAFMAIWSALTGPVPTKPVKVRAKKEAPRRTRRKAKPVAKVKAVKVKAAGNDNVVTFPAA